MLGPVSLDPTLTSSLQACSVLTAGGKQQAKMKKSVKEVEAGRSENKDVP
jgi:hypothetical protein